MPFDINTASNVQDTEAGLKQSGGFDISSARPVEAEGNTTDFEKFSKPAGVSMPKEEKPHKTVMGPTGYPDEGMLNAVVHSAQGAAWNLIAKPILGMKDPDVDKYLKDIETKHPIASAIGGTAPYIVSAPLFPEGLIGITAQFGVMGALSEVGRQRVDESLSKPIMSKVGAVASETGKSAALGPIWHYSNGLQFIGRPFSSVLARAGVRGAGTATLGAVFGDNLTEAFRQGGTMTALSLMFESPALAKSVIGRGIVKHANSVYADIAVKVGLPKTKIDPESPDVKSQIQTVTEGMATQIKADQPKIVSAVVKFPNGKEIDSTSHEDALNQAGLSKDAMAEGEDFQAGFRTSEGKFITREQAKEQFGVDRSEDVKGLNQQKFLAKPEEIRIVNPKTLESIEQIKEKTGINAINSFLENRYESKPFSQEMEKGFQILRGEMSADELEMRQILRKANFNSKDVEAAYHFDENKGEIITPEQEQIYEKYVKPLKQEYGALFADIKNKGVPLPEEGYTPRFAVDKGNVFDWMKSKIKRMAGGGSLLKQTSGAFKKRTMKALTDKEGNRIVVHIDSEKNVTRFDNKKTSDLGKLKVETNEEILNKELEPLERQAKALNKEISILSKTQSREKSAYERLWGPKNIFGERSGQKGAHSELADVYDRIADVYARHTAGDVDLNGKSFLDKNGREWKIGEATTKEIEANTDVKYHKNVVLNYMTRVMELRKIQRAIDFLEGLKNDPEFQKFSRNEISPLNPENYKPTSLPQFRGMAFEPRIADVLNSFNDKLYRQENPYQTYAAINSFLRTAIFFNPAIHIPNIGVHWLVNRGTMKWAIPSEYGKLFETGSKAWEAVKTQNKDYQDMLRSGVNLLYHNHVGETLPDLMMKKMGEEVKGNKELAKQLAADLGTKISPYSFSGKVTWFANDLATMQAIFEEMASGKTREEAINNVAKHIPNYVIPSRIMDNRNLGNLMSDPNITMFGAYHYGALKSYGEMVKSLIGKTPLSERAEAADKLAMLGLTMFVLYPQMDKFARWVTGNPEAHFRRAGATTVPENISKLEKNQIDIAQVIQSVMTPSVGVRMLSEIIQNKDWLTGRKIIHHGQEISGLKDVVVSSISPLSAASRIAEGKISLKDWSASLFGISVSNPNASRLYNMMDDKQDAMKDINKISITDPNKAKELRDMFNSQQANALKEVSKEEGIKDIPLSVLGKFIITSEDSREKQKKTTKDILSKQKAQKRKRVLTPEAEMMLMEKE